MTPKADLTCRIATCNKPGVTLGAHICEAHALDIWHAVELRDCFSHRDVPGREGREFYRSEMRAKRKKTRLQPSAVGEIYFVRTGGLIKVGWTTKLYDRVRSYGPDAVLLAHYKATRADEAALHRQLAPARYKGREWYTETDVIKAFVAEALERHGAPLFSDTGWREPSGPVPRIKGYRG